MESFYGHGNLEGLIYDFFADYTFLLSLLEEMEVVFYFVFLRGDEVTCTFEDAVPIMTLMLF